MREMKILLLLLFFFICTLGEIALSFINLFYIHSNGINRINTVYRIELRMTDKAFPIAVTFALRVLCRKEERGDSDGREKRKDGKGIFIEGEKQE